ncbi:hypothetical protein GYMLUDRAFT_38541 [Collybiopsis luxurians FD-317 M1]|nr:hypothetical protein GYMLUDRAFT_38541 [Collybiopsis luxurians FD-317 M1]
MPPVHKLPPELLSVIFHLLDDPPPVFLLSSVCSRWRSIVIETPALWRTILLPALSINQLQIHLQRSRPCTLAIRVYASVRVFDDRLLTLVAEHSERWEEAVFSMRGSLYTSLSSVRGRIPLLRRLKFNAPTSYEVPDFKGFEIAPALREVMLKPLNDKLIRDIPIPIVQLTKLQIFFYDTSFLCSFLTRTPKVSQLSVSGYSLASVTAAFPDVSFPDLTTLNVGLCQIPLINFLLSRAPNLTTLRVHGFALRDIPTSSSEITLPHLRCLIFDDRGLPYFVSETLKSLRVPRLSVLELNEHSPELHLLDTSARKVLSAMVIGSARDLIIRSECKLETFKLTTSTDPAPEIASLFQEMPSLQYLHISVQSLSQVPFYSMTSVAQVLPKLQILSLSAQDWNGPAALSDLVAFARMNDKLKVSFLRRADEL